MQFMNRRNFLKGMGLPASVTALSVLTATAYKSKQAVNSTKTSIEKRVQALTKRMDRMEHRNKQLTRAVLAVGAVSTGVDLTFLL